MAAVVRELLILFGLSQVNSSILDFYDIFHCHSTKAFFLSKSICVQVSGSPVQRSASV